MERNSNREKRDLVRGISNSAGRSIRRRWNGTWNKNLCRRFCHSRRLFLHEVLFISIIWRTLNPAAVFQVLYFNLALIPANEKHLWCFKKMFNVKLKRESMHFKKNFSHILFKLEIFLMIEKWNWSVMVERTQQGEELWFCNLIICYWLINKIN